MSRTAPSGIPREGVLIPKGRLLWTIDEITEGETKSEPHKYCINLKLTCTEPAECAGMPYFETCTIGNDKDPNADDVATWKGAMGAKSLNSMGEAANGTKFEGDVDSFVASVKGQTVGAAFVHKIEPKFKTVNGQQVENKWYTGYPKHDRKRWFKPGTVPTGLDPTDDPAPEANGAIAGAPAVPATAPAAPMTPPPPAAVRP